MTGPDGFGKRTTQVSDIRKTDQLNTVLTSKSKESEAEKLIRLANLFIDYLDSLEIIYLDTFTGRDQVSNIRDQCIKFLATWIVNHDTSLIYDILFRALIKESLSLSKIGEGITIQEITNYVQNYQAFNAEKKFQTYSLPLNDPKRQQQVMTVIVIQVKLIIWIKI